MAHTSPLTGSRIIDLADAPNGPQAFSNAVLDLEDNTIPRFSTASARDAAFSTWTAAGNSFASGLTCFTQSDGRYWRYDTASSSWKYAGGNSPPIAVVAPGAGWNGVATNQAGVYVDSSGLIHLVGAMSPQTSYNPQDGGTHTLGTLPSGYRPTSSQFFLAGAPPGILVYCRADPSGTIFVIGGTSGSVAGGVSHYLDGATFHGTYNSNSVPLA